jgi:hypothetical protein
MCSTLLTSKSSGLLKARAPRNVANNEVTLLVSKLSGWSKIAQP